jgi:hypothetical protein
MAYSASFGYATYTQLAMANGKYLMAFKLAAPETDVKRYHPPGVNGTMAIVGGRTAQRISARVRYVASTAANLESTWDTDVAALHNTTFETTGPGGKAYQRCVLINAEPAADIVATGRGKVFRDFTLTVESLG